MTTGWLSGYGYRQSHVISHAANAGTLYQRKIKVHSGTGTSTTDDVYLKGHCLHFPYDINFSDDAGTPNQLSFWVEDLALDPIVCWVKVTADLTSTDQTIYVFYGKDAQTTSLSDGANTFLSFDDFENGTNGQAPAGWTVDAVIPIIVSTTSTYVKAGTKGIKIGPSTSGNRINDSHKVISTLSVDKVNAIEFDAEINVDDGNYNYIQISNGAPTGGDCILISGRSSTWYHLPGGSWGSLVQTYALGAFHHFKIYDIDFTNHKYSIDIDGVNRANQSAMIVSEAQVTWFGIGSGGLATFTSGIDNLFVRRNVNPEPANSTWGAEETPSGNYSHVFTQYVGGKESNSRLAVRIRTFSDKVGAKETRSRLAARIRVFTGKVGGKDSFSRLAVRLRTWTDKVGAKDTKAKTVVRFRAFLDKVGALESFTHSTIVQYVHVFTQGIGVVGSKARQAVRYRIFTQLAGARDSNLRLIQRFRTFTDKLGVKGSYFRLAARTRIFIDRVGSKESYLRTVVRFRAFLNNMGVLESFTHSIGGAINHYVHVFIERVGALDIKTKYVSRYKIFMQSLGVKDSKLRIVQRFRLFTGKVGLMDNLKSHKVVLGSFRWKWGEYPSIRVQNEDE